MSTYKASACAKIILCGEHAVVYGRPAIAVPIPDLRAYASFTPTTASGLRVHLDDMGERWTWNPHHGHPIAVVIRHTLNVLRAFPPSGDIHVRSQIPIGGGLGSSAAVATAVVRVIARALGRALSPEAIAAIVYEGETIWHGTPSGIDNTVIAHERPIWFIRERPPQVLQPLRAFTLVIGDTGIRASTRDVVAEVRRRWAQKRTHYETLFDRIGRTVYLAREALQQGDLLALGRALTENQRLLHALGVSSPELERLTRAAMQAGALGAKLAGAGRGGNMIALVWPDVARHVANALRDAGAVRTFVTTIPGKEDEG